MSGPLVEADARYCHNDDKRMTADLDARVYRCDHCEAVRPFGEGRRPLVTARSARSLVAAYRALRASGEPLPIRRVRVASSEVSA